MVKSELLKQRGLVATWKGEIEREFLKENFHEVDRVERERMQRHVSILGNLVLVLDERLSAMREGPGGVKDPWLKRWLLRRGL